MFFFPFRLQYTYLKPVTAAIVLMFLCVAAFILQLVGVLDPYAWGLLRGVREPYRLVTHVFFHGNFTHLILNLTTFIVFAQVVNAAVGTRLFLLVCLVTALGSAIPELLFDRELRVTASIGLSGVIAGLVVLGCLWIPRVKVRFVFWFIFLLGFIDFSVWTVGATWVAADTYMVVTGRWLESSTSHWGHLGGFASGVMCYFVLRSFRAVELTGFALGAARKARHGGFWRRLKVARAVRATEESEGSGQSATCLRCGYATLLAEPPGEKPLRCRRCGQQSRELRGQAEDPEAGPRRRRCALMLSVEAAILALAAFLLQVNY